MILNPKINEIRLTPIVGLDTEFNTLDILNSDILAISITNNLGDTYVLDRSTYSNKELIELFYRIKTCKTVVCHNTKVDIGIVYSNFGILLRNGFCTMLASQIIDNGYTKTGNMVGNKANLVPGPHSLNGVLQRYLDITLSEGSDKKRLQKSFVGVKLGAKLTEEQLLYAGNDTKYLIPLYFAQQKCIEDRNLYAIVKLENTLTPVLIKMEFRGCLIDVNRHRQNIQNWEETLKTLTKKLDNIILDLSNTFPCLQGGKYTNERRQQKVSQLDMFGGHPVEFTNKNVNNINYASSAQIEEIFDKLNLPKPTDDDGKVSFGENCLLTYINNNPDSVLADFLTVLLEYREYTKLLGTYGDKLFSVLDSNQRLRSNYSQCFAATGRLTSSEIVRRQLGFNLANIPKRKDIRAIFIPDEGYSFIDSDFTGQEVILAGDYSKDPVLMKAFQEGFDHHSFLASISYSLIFGRKIEIVNEDKEFTIDGHTYNHKKLRDDHKSCLFAKFYGGGKMRVMNVLNKYLVNHLEPHKREDVADQISKALNKALPVLTEYLKTKVQEVKDNGYVVANKLGRRRYFDEPESAFGDAMNMPIQASGADCVKISLIKIDKWLSEKSKELGIREEELGWITMTIYDQNLVCLNDKYIDLAPEIPRLMAESINYFLTDLEGSSDLNIRKFWAK